MADRCEYCGDTGMRSYPARRVTTGCNMCTPEQRASREAERSRVFAAAMAQFRLDNPDWKPWQVGSNG